MASYKSPISVVDVGDKKTRDALLIALDNCQYLKEKVDELKREIELLKRKAV
jgi:hypothetical protein